MAKIEINEADLRADIEKYLVTYAQTYAKSASEEFTKSAKDVIGSVYYGGYSPNYYHRTDDLKNNSYRKYCKNNGDTYYGGVIISSDDMSDYTNIWGDRQSTTPASSVVEWAWGAGYHGYTGGNPENGIYSFPPISALEMEIGIKTDNINNEAIKVAKSQQYSVLQF